MEGCIRNTGIHACGVIITPEDVSNLVPVTIAAKDADILVSQFDNSVAESAGLLKMDFRAKNFNHHQRCFKTGKSKME
jgi:DNA polymerase-3 subunit alpha